MALTRDAAAAVLGVDENATEAQVGAAFKARARLLHPDQHPEGSTARATAEASMKQLNEARDILAGRAKAKEPPRQAQPQPAPPPPSQPYQQPYQQPAPPPQQEWDLPTPGPANWQIREKQITKLRKRRTRSLIGAIIVAVLFLAPQLLNLMFLTVTGRMAGNLAGSSITGTVLWGLIAVWLARRHVRAGRALIELTGSK